MREFHASKGADKRDKLIDSLTGTDAFVDQWAWMWMDLFQSIDQGFNYWFKQRLKLDRPYNEVFAEIAGVGASKNNNSIPAWGATAKVASYSNRDVTRLPAQDQLIRFNRLDFIDASAVLLGRVFLGVLLLLSLMFIVLTGWSGASWGQQSSTTPELAGMALIPAVRNGGSG